MENILIYQQNSETIRQMPQNYLIAFKRENRWVCEPDLAADKELSTRVFNALWDYNTKYGSGLNLLSKVTSNSEFKKLYPMKKLQTTLNFFIALWRVLPVWLKTIIVFLIVVAMGQNGIFDKPY